MLENKSDFNKAMERIYAWYEQELTDRPPIRFVHNPSEPHPFERNWPDMKSCWFDAEFQIDRFIHSLKERSFLAETFPIYWPNLGPEVFSAYYGSELLFQKTTSYAVPMVNSWEDLDKLKLDPNNIYFKKTEELTQLAIKKCTENYLVGYTDFHPGVDCAAAWRDPQSLCTDLFLEPERVRELIGLAHADFQRVFDHFDTLLKASNHLSVTWLEIPSFGKMHIPSCDFASMISSEQFEEFILPGLIEEVKAMTHNIFHVDGKGVARHIDMILDIPGLNAIQWVQGAGEDQPIMKWIPLIRKIQAAGKSVVVDLQLNELNGFIREIDPKGIFLTLQADPDLQTEIIKKVEKWKKR